MTFTEHLCTRIRGVADLTILSNPTGRRILPVLRVQRRIHYSSASHKIRTGQERVGSVTFKSKRQSYQSYPIIGLGYRCIWKSGRNVAPLWKICDHGSCNGLCGSPDPPWFSFGRFSHGSNWKSFRAGHRWPWNTRRLVSRFWQKNFIVA